MKKSALLSDVNIRDYFTTIRDKVTEGDHKRVRELFNLPLQSEPKGLSRVLVDTLAMLLLHIESCDQERERLMAEIESLRKELENNSCQSRTHNLRLHASARNKSGDSATMGATPAMQALKAQAERLAASGSTLLISGETGSGKGVLARHIHSIGPRASRPFVDINCAAIPVSLLESELFGIEAGVASGVNARVGRFEQADGGTLLLDEIGDMPLESQGKILQILESGAVERVGGRKRIPVNVRIMAATHRNLEELTRSGQFRQDLFYRLHVVKLHVPPLRERAQDIPLLAAEILHKISLASPGLPGQLSPAALALLMRHDWPGNIRELRNALERAALFAHGPVITEADAASALCRPTLDAAAEPAAGIVTGPAPAPEADRNHTLTLEEAVDRHIRETLLQNGGNKSLTARTLGISRESLRIKLAKRAATP